MFRKCFCLNPQQDTTANPDDAPDSPPRVQTPEPAAAHITAYSSEPVLTGTVQRSVNTVKEEEGDGGIQKQRPAPSLGVIRLDYKYPPALGDVDCSATFGYKVYYRVVKGLTFEMCQKGLPALTLEARDNFGKVMRELEDLNVSVITGDCGFMFWFQDEARKHSRKPLLLSSLVQLPTITCTLAGKHQVAIFTANDKSLEPMMDEIDKACGVTVRDNRFVVVGCENVPGFQAVAEGTLVDVAEVKPGIVKLAKDEIARNPSIKALLLECTELPPYAQALREATGLPVYDAITCCNYFIDGFSALYYGS